MDLDKKYRPHRIEDIVGQQVPVQILKNSFGKWHHAYLLSGMLGSGKTSILRIMAASQNCEKGPSLNPCGKCKNCKQIFEGKSVDVIELDAASNRGIDQIRDIKRQAQFAPINSKVKYIGIDQCHGLTGIAAQALLKFIEQPPPHVRIVLATTDPQLLKPTVHSRCMSLHFGKIDWMDLFNLLKKVSSKQQIVIDDDSLRIMSRQANGSARQALSSLQSVRDFCGTTSITSIQTQKVLNTVGSQMYFKLFQAAQNKNMPKVMQLLNNVFKTAKKSQIVIEDMHYHLRSLRTARICSRNIQTMMQFGYTKIECQRFLQQSNVFSPVIVNKMEQRLIQLIKALQVNAKPQYFLEWYFQAAIIDIIKNEKIK